MTHSLLPWALDASDDTTIVDGHKHFVADVDVGHDAAFIIRAVNAHDDLVSALQQSRKTIRILADFYSADEIERLRSILAMDSEQHAAHVRGLNEAHEVRIKEYGNEIERLRAELTDAKHMLSIAVADYAGEKARAEKAEALLRECLPFIGYQAWVPELIDRVEALAQKEPKK